MNVVKNFLIALALIAGTGVMAQQDNEKPIFEKNGDLIKATYFHAEGVVSQQGTFKDGELHGTWVSYDASGSKLAMGQYIEGVKTGKWFFWGADKLSEVDYTDNKIASVQTWKNDALVSSK